MNDATTMDTDRSGPEAPETRRIATIGPARRYDPGHSRRVRSLRVIFPLAAAILMALVIAWPYLQPDTIGFTVGFATNDIDGGTSTVMVNPRYMGTDRRDRPYTVTADLAHNVTLDTQEVTLDNPQADITLEDGTWVVVTAEDGLFLREDETLTLTGSVNLFQDEGYELKTDSVDVRLADGTATSTTPTQGHGPLGELQSEGFHIIDIGKTIMFTGNARLTIFPAALGTEE